MYADLQAQDGEFVPYIFDGTATPIKTHRLPTVIHDILKEVNRAILIFRNPFDVFKSEYKRRKVGKIGSITAAQLSGKYHIP